MVPRQRAHSAGKIGFFFHLGHGHYTQFLNFQQGIPREYSQRALWVPLRGESSGHRLARLPGLPASRRYALHQMWHARRALAENPDCSTIFCAAEVTGLVEFMGTHRCFLYTDLTPSLKRELAPWYDHQLLGNPLLLAAKRRRRNQLYQKCAGIFAMSAWAAAGFARDYGIPSERLHVVLPGANLALWGYVNREIRRDTRPVRILMVGGQFKLKGGEMLLRWAAETRSRNWEMDIVTWPGELPPWLRGRVDAAAAGGSRSCELGPELAGVRIHCGLTANTPELMGLYEDADVFCLPTQADGSSIASLEAMACGLPVLVGAVGGIPELIEDGATGFLLPRGDYDAMAAQLDRLVADRELRLKTGCAARQSCEDYFNVERQMRDILRVLDCADLPVRRAA
jgi:glycosyltransferase involved in cell wall biosynthesis